MKNYFKFILICAPN